MTCSPIGFLSRITVNELLLLSETETDLLNNHRNEPFQFIANKHCTCRSALSGCLSRNMTDETKCLCATLRSTIDQEKHHMEKINKSPSHRHENNSLKSSPSLGTPFCCLGYQTPSCFLLSLLIGTCQPPISRFPSADLVSVPSFLSSFIFCFSTDRSTISTIAIYQAFLFYIWFIASQIDLFQKKACQYPSKRSRSLRTKSNDNITIKMFMMARIIIVMMMTTTTMILATDMLWHHRNKTSPI